MPERRATVFRDCLITLALLARAVGLVALAALVGIAFALVHPWRLP